MKERLKKIQVRTLLIHVVITLAYPAVKAGISAYNRLLIFTDALTIVAAVLLIGGVLYALYLRGDFDVTSFVMKRGLRGKREEGQSYQAYKDDRKAEREEAFNYPLFLGVVYLAAALILAYGVL